MLLARGGTTPAARAAAHPETEVSNATPETTGTEQVADKAERKVARTNRIRWLARHPSHTTRYRLHPTMGGACQSKRPWLATLSPGSQGLIHLLVMQVVDPISCLPTSRHPVRVATQM